MKNPRTRFAFLLSLFFLFLTAVPAPAQQNTPAQSSRLDPLARLVGNWRGQIKLLDGTVIEARNIFEWSLDGKALRFRAYGITNGQERHVYDGLYGWHPQQQRIVFREQSAFGTLIDGMVEPEGDTLVFTWTQHGADKRVEYRETFRFPDQDTYVTEVYRQTEKGWERFTQENRFVREKQNAPAALATSEPWQRSLRNEVTRQQTQPKP